MVLISAAKKVQAGSATCVVMKRIIRANMAGLRGFERFESARGGHGTSPAEVEIAGTFEEFADGCVRRGPLYCGGVVKTL
jgi:hypothetical protein